MWPILVAHMMCTMEHQESGPFTAKSNMKPVKPPEQIGCIPQYSPDKLQDLQQTFTESLGVFTIPPLNPSPSSKILRYQVNASIHYFVVNNQISSYWLLAAFAGVERYSKPQPSLMPNASSTLQSESTYLSSPFYQILLSKVSMNIVGYVIMTHKRKFWSKLSFASKRGSVVHTLWDTGT